MEDLSTIIWTVVIVGAMIFNSVAKARRARANAKGEDAPQHDEAWPSIPWEEERKVFRDPAPETQPEQREQREQRGQRGQRGQREQQGQQGLSGQSARSAQPEQAAYPIQSTRPVQPAGSTGPQPFAETGSRGASEGLKALVSSSEQHLEQLPDGSGTARKGGKSAEIGAGRATRTGGSNGSADRLRENIAEESATEIAEEFDLRRAVIYSEILKPKFEEL